MAIITPYFLTREPSTGNGTFGKLTDEGGNELCLTVELQWLDNHPKTSCIPAGTYSVEKYISPRHGHVWHILNVPHRSMIEIHGANTIKDLLGCIGVGDERGIIDGLPAVLNSQATLQRLRETLPDKFVLTVKDAI